MLTNLKTGELIVVLQKRDNIKVRARKQAKTKVGVRIRGDDSLAFDDLFYPDPIPNGDIALYMGSHVDSLHEALKKKSGPFGLRHDNIVFHLVFWKGMAVWVSSEDAELQRVK